MSEEEQNQQVDEGVIDFLDESSVDETQQHQQQVDGQQQQQQQEDTPLTADAITKAVVAGMQTAVPKPKEEEPKQLTQEEIDEQLKTAKYSADDLVALGLINAETPAEEADKKVAILSEIINRGIQQAIATNSLLVQHHTGQIAQQMQPIQQYYQQQQQQQMVAAFYDKYPVLSEYEDVVKMASAQVVQAGGIEDKSFDEVAELIANATVQSIKNIAGVDIDLKSQATQQSQQQKQTQQKPVKKAVVKPANTAAGGRSQQQQSQQSGDDSGEFAFYDD